MILKLDYDQVENTAVKGIFEGKTYNFYMRIKVNEDNIQEAINRFRGSKYLVGLDYEGDLSLLSKLNREGVTIIIKHYVENLGVNDALPLINLTNVKEVIKLPDDFFDMKVIYDLSIRYPNIRFCGGKLIRLKGCNAGCIGVEDINKKLVLEKIPVIGNGCLCVLPSVTLKDLEYVEFYSDKGLVKKERKKDRRVSSILLKAQGDPFANF